MEIEGTLAKWNDDRGFGFIAPTLGGQEIFVHVSAFPRDGKRPRIGESLQFSVEQNRDGKKRAVDVRRPVRARVRPVADAPARRSRRPRRGAGTAITLALLVALGIYGYSEVSRRSSMPAEEDAYAPPAAAIASSPARPDVNFRCDGRTYCSQMTSCAEATYFLRNCPGVKMDGDHDGVPCEQQWCTGPFAK